MMSRFNPLNAFRWTPNGLVLRNRRAASRSAALRSAKAGRVGRQQSTAEEPSRVLRAPSSSTTSVRSCQMCSAGGVDWWLVVGVGSWWLVASDWWIDPCSGCWLAAGDTSGDVERVAAVMGKVAKLRAAEVLRAAECDERRRWYEYERRRWLQTGVRRS